MPKLKKKKKAPAKKKVIKKKPAKKSAIKKAKPIKKVIKKKAPAKKTKKPIKKPAPKKVKQEKGFLGEITHYFPKVRAAVIQLKDTLSLGDKIKIKGHTTDFTQKITSLQIDRVAINVAQKGDEIGFQVESRVRKGDKVTKI